MKSIKSKAYAVPALTFFAVAVLLFPGCCSTVGCDYKSQVSGERVITQTNPSWRLSTPNANKDCHAYFTLEYGWVNKDRAKDVGESDPARWTGADNTKSAVQIEFGTGWGIFLNPRPTKVTEEGVTKWKIVFDQGAKNELYNPVNYYISVIALVRPSEPPGLPADYYDVWGKGQIEYYSHPD